MNLNYPLFVANWKMNFDLEMASSFVKGFIPQLRGAKGDVIICPPTAFLIELSKLAQGTKLMLGCQNVHYAPSGAFTGETSVGMISSFCKFVIVGHSERRHIFGETNEVVNKKVRAVLDSDAGLIVILCVGETLEERDVGRAEEVIKSQLIESLSGVSDFSRVIIAYEPVWAIGTGKTASPEDAESIHAFIRRELDKLKSPSKILYGGSVKPVNTSQLLAQNNIDGVLVGGASLDLSSFTEIVSGGRNASN